MKRKENLRIFVALITIGVLFITGFNSVIALEDTEKTITVGTFQAPATLDPANHRQIMAQNVIRMMGEGLMDDLPDTSYIYSVAESITELDPLSYEIKIREGITFHNGDPVTADDVIFTWERLTQEGAMEGATSPRRPLLPVDSVEKVDDYTVIARIKTYSSILQRRWFHWEVMPKKYFEEVGIDGYLEHPIGCGPFKYVSGDTNTELVLERYDNYYGGPDEVPGVVDQVPAVDRVILKYITEPTTRVAALLAGEVDIIQDVPVDMLPLLKSNPDIEIASIASNSMTCLALNVNRPPFDDKRVRQAVGCAINYEMLVNQMFSGEAKILGGIPFLEFYSTHPAYHDFDHIKSIKYDPEKAKSLLEEAGATGATIVIDTWPENSEPAQAIAQMLNEVGLNASVRIWEAGVISAEVQKGERLAYLVSIGNGLRTPDWIVRFTSNKPTNSNYFKYTNHDFDDRMNRAGAMRYSTEQIELFDEAFKIFMDDLPIITIYAKNVIDAHRSNIRNYYAYANRWTKLHRVDIE